MASDSMEMMNPPDAGVRPVKLRSLTSRAVLVPLNFTLGTSAAIVRKVPLLLVDLMTDDGTVGHAYVFCYRPSGARAIAAHLAEAFELLAGTPVTPSDAARRALCRVSSHCWASRARCAWRFRCSTWLSGMHSRDPGACRSRLFSEARREIFRLMTAAALG